MPSFRCANFSAETFLSSFLVHHSAQVSIVESRSKLLKGTYNEKRLLVINVHEVSHLSITVLNDGNIKANQ